MMRLYAQGASHYNLFLDDERMPSEVTWVPGFPKLHWIVVRSVPEFKSTIMSMGLPDVISFDHDLAKGSGSETGADAAKFLFNYIVDTLEGGMTVTVPEVYIHTQNIPWGYNNILGYINDIRRYIDSLQR